MDMQIKCFFFLIALFISLGFSQSDTLSYGKWDRVISCEDSIRIQTSIDSLKKITAIELESKININNNDYKAGKYLQSAANYQYAAWSVSVIGTILIITENYKTGSIVSICSIPLSFAFIYKIKKAGKLLSSIE